MKKFLTLLLCIVTALCFAVGFYGCSDGETENTERNSYTMYMPDGAPALAAAMLMSQNPDLGADVTYTVVDSKVIATCVNGDSPKADVCILPVNAAAKALGTGTTYQLLGTVTHGNLYILSKDGTEITTSNLSSLVGKTVGVVNLSNVPGLTLEVIFKDNNIDYNIIGNGGSTSSTAVNLADIDSDNVMQDISGHISDYDYFVVPEPAATLVSNKLSLSRVGNLQTLYGGENGYPQAVVVAKKSVIESDSAFITALTTQLSTTAEWVKTAEVDTIVSAINAHYDTTSSLSANNLSSAVIANCAIYFTSAVDCKTEIQSFLSKYAQVATDGATYETADAFYYGYNG
ncbi:MAG: hypothetical protein LUI60_04210 [Clostridia bacterium]|nr:hypothetical protein [Clostridia bacterium]